MAAPPTPHQVRVPMSAWLIAPDALEALREARQRPIDADAAERLEALSRSMTSGSPAGYRVDGDTATITVAGVLTRTPDPLMRWLMGATTAYAEIGEALAMAEAAEDVHRVTLAVDSPGGEVDGLHELMERLLSYSLPIDVQARHAMSAAYGIAAAAGPITATSPASSIGSVGVALSMWTSDRVVHVTDRDAPAKRPDPRTEEGRAVLEDYLDEHAALFRGGIARGRGVSAEHVAQHYGRGGIVLAEHALRLGMIDRIAGSRSTTTTTRASRGEETAHMDPDQLRRQYPDAVDQIEQAAAAAERARVVGHLDLAVSSGARALAETAIREGAPVDAAAANAHVDHRVRAHEQSLRQQDCDAAGLIADGAIRQLDHNTDPSHAMAQAIADRMGLGSQGGA